MIAQGQQDYRLQELGDFLRTRRARLAPETVGLPRGSRRKTPGLRRAEVAQLVGVSVDWYTWLEQGRDITPSTLVLERLVQALRLDANERNHLFLLAQQQSPPPLAQENETVSPALQRFLDQFGARPAFVSGHRWEILASNDAGSAVFGDYRKRTGRERNTLWNVFTNPLSRQFIVDWEDDARHLIAQFRSTVGRHPADPELNALIDDLMVASPEFRAWWPDHEVRSGQESRKLLNHPDVGLLQFERMTFQLFDAPELKITVYTPLDSVDTPRKMQQLMNQWYQSEGRAIPNPDRNDPVMPERDTVSSWLTDCCTREDGAWTANSAVMTAYTHWCAAHGVEPRKAKSVSQALAADGFEISVNKRVSDEHGGLKMTRGVRGLVIA